MNNVVRIVCPGAEKNREERITGLVNSCYDWMYSEHMKALVSLFDNSGFAVQLGDNREADIESLHDFVKIWDYRNGKERWTVEDEQFITDNSKFIMEHVRALGLVDIVTPQKEPDYILPLGGARLANAVRPAMAKKVLDDQGYHGKTIVALSGTRPLSEIERPYVDEYAPNAVTEFEAISSGLEKTFGVKEFTEKREENENINLCSAVRRYDDTYKDCVIYSLAAPSSDPENRRANSYDTFEFLLKHFEIGHDDKLLLVTSCIYVPFQQLKFMGLAINQGFEVDCIGSDVVDSGKFSKASNYLQEVKGTVDAIYSLTKQFGII